MSRVAWLSCAILALAHARVYERCELARDLHALGVDPEHIATWVCIAYHESRFDTAANNPYSGDHGIFQISELFWCGPGKACGLPCSALRDDDISNDLECALQVHEEHTRLQGNGFLAWVVYPQHCKHNTKKYLVDCDTNIKNSAPIVKSRGFSYHEGYNSNVNNTRPNVEDLLPPYLAISNIFRGSYGKVLDNNRVDWYNYKINNIDDLKIPSSFVEPSRPVTEAPTTTTTTTTQTTTTVYIPPVMPWKRIETNQFRKKNLFDNNSYNKQITDKEYSYVTSNAIESSRTSTTFTTLSTQTTTSPRPSATTSVTYAPRITTPRTSTVDYTTVKPSTTTSSTTTTSTTTLSTTTNQPSTQKHRSTTTPSPFFFTTRKPYFNIERSTTTVKPVGVEGTTRSWFTFTTPTSTTSRPTTRWTRLTTKTPTPSTTAITTARTTTRNYDTTTKKPKFDFSLYTFTSRTATPTPSTTPTTTTTTRPQATFSSTPPPLIYSSTTPQPLIYSSTIPTPASKTRSTQSIFDLYLNPTKPPKLIPFDFGSFNNHRIKIFASGTTTPVPTKQTPTERNEGSGTSKNQIKRE